MSLVVHCSKKNCWEPFGVSSQPDGGSSLVQTSKHSNTLRFSTGFNTKEVLVVLGNAELYLRSYLPCKPVLCTASIGGLSDYAEMSSRYKASTIKLMVWWLAMKTSAIAEHSEDPYMLRVLMSRFV